MIISKGYRFIYFQIAHTGYTSMAKICRKKFGGVINGHHSINFPSMYKNFFKFTIVRNPYTRMFSWWWFNKNANLKYKSTFEEFMFDLINRKNKLVYPPADPEDMIYDSQINWIKRAKIDKYIKLENIMNDSSILAQLPFVNKTLKFPWLNKNQVRPNGSAFDFLNKKQLDLIVEYAEEDFKEFGYEI